MPFDTADVMADRCLKLCDDWRLREKIGEQAREKKRSMFSLEKTVCEIDDILQSI